MGLNGADFERLRVSAASFGSKNHTHYLAEAMQCMRVTGDPVEALALLRAMWSSPYAGRNDMKLALNDVGKWLEQQLGRDPKLTAEAVALQLGWLRRLAMFAMEERRGADVPSGRSQGGPNSRAPDREFGDRIEGIRKRRVDAANAQLAELSRPVPPPPPQCLPDVFAARFRDFLAAREARKTAKDRVKKGKPPKDTLIDLLPVDERFIPLALGLRCSTLRTEGFDILFQEVEKRNNAPVPFYVADLNTTDGTLLVGKIHLASTHSTSNP